MVKGKKQFQVGDLVFAKVKGYPAWPAKITKNNNNKKFAVYFYGTGETANIKIEDLFHYLETKAKFATQKNLKVSFLVYVENYENTRILFFLFFPKLSVQTFVRQSNKSKPL